MKKSITWKLFTRLKGWAEKKKHPVLKGIAYRLRGVKIW